MFIGEGRVPFDTLIPFIPRLPSPSDVFPAKIQNGGTTVVVERNASLLAISLEEESLVNSDDDDIHYPSGGCNLYGARSSQK